MNDLQIFLKTRIKYTNSWADYIANLFLTPTRFFLSGKTIIVANDGSGNIAKVSSFSAQNTMDNKKSKQSANLTSSNIFFLGPLPSFFVLAFFTVTLIPFTIIGSILKLFSYINPEVRKNHHIVKRKLTPENQSLTCESAEQFGSVLEKYLLTGQKTGNLVITVPEDVEMGAQCVNEIIKINPSKVILVGKLSPSSKIHLHEQFSKKKSGDTRLIPLVCCRDDENDESTKWDTSALKFASSPSPSNDPYSAPTTTAPSNIVSSVKAAENASLSFFGFKHVVYVVKNEPQQASDEQKHPNHQVGLGCPS